MKSKSSSLGSIFMMMIFFGVMLAAANRASADPPDINTYCSTPPFLVTPTPPNIMVVMDNSLSMNCAAYDSGYDPSQFASGNYYGYFHPTSLYQYASSKWAKYTGSNPSIDATTTSPIASGNLLNWASMRRVEVSKKLLVGGNQNPRTPPAGQTVKLVGENTSGYCASFDKAFNNTTAPGLIYPFTGNYRYTRSGSGLSVSPVSSANTDNVRPNSNVSVPAAWVVTGAGGVAWDAVDDVAADTTTYIRNTTTTTPAIFGYKPYAPTIAGTISNVTIRIRMMKAASGTMRVEGVFRMKGPAGDVDYNQPYANLSTSYADYDFSLATNPQTGVAWQFADLTGNAVGSMVGFGVRANTTPTSSQYPTVTQIFMIVTVSNPSGGPYSFVVDTGHAYGDAAERGIMNSLSADVRFGLAYYATSNQGAKVDQIMDFGITSNMVASINNMTPATYTPLAESLYETVNYLKQVSPYYSNSPADYQTGVNYDPFYFRYSGSPSNNKYVPCSKAFILFLTDGESTEDQSIPNAIKGYAPASVRFAGTPVGTTYPSNGTDYMIDVAYWMRKDNSGDLRPGACTTTPTSFNTCIPGKQGAVLYNVFLFGSGSTLLKDAAITGGFYDANNNNQPDCTTSPAECFRDTDGDGVVESNGDDLPLTYYEGDDGYALEKSILDAITAILRRSASGTAASVLASGEGSGANLIQSIFYPKRAFFDSKEVGWTSTLQNLWYYIDPRTASSSIRENTADSIGATAKELNLKLDRIVNFQFNQTEQKTEAQLFADADGNGIKDSVSPVSTVDVSDLKYLWEAGLLLWNTSAASRNIYTPLDMSQALTNSSNAFTTANLATSTPTLRTLLNTDITGRTAAQNNAVASNIIDYIRGTDVASCSAATCGADITYRPRTVAIDLNKDNDAADTVNGISEAAKVWKLADIVNSTPRIASWIPLNNYHNTYADGTYAAFVKTSTYTNRGMVFAGANDGMLHAFKLGTLSFGAMGVCSITTSTSCSSSTDCPVGESCTFSEKASLVGSNLGTEQWAFIPKHVLPYLQYFADPAYCHLYYVDGTPFIFDASIAIPAGCTATNYWDCTKTVDSWRTILIGSSRLGGSCKSSAYTGSYGVKVPMANVGLSSYFALDVTDPSMPKLLWEFAPTDGSLGFSTSGPAVVKISAREADPNDNTKSIPNKTKNGRWFVVFASGPTGPIDMTYHQFKGYSDQNLKLFVLDVAGNGTALRTIDTGLANAFGGSLNNASIDYDFDYQDDLLYLGYVKSEVGSPTSSTKWTQGGVLRLLMREDMNGMPVSTETALNPNKWEVSTLIADIGAVTSAVGHLAHYKTKQKSPDNAFLYFGTGRYFFNTLDGIDDTTSQRRLFGVSEPCLAKILANQSCGNSEIRAFSDLTLASTSAGTTDADGWYINLDVAAVGASTYNERVITDPLASPTGAVFYTTFAPTSDICSYGGKSYLWAVRYDTGGSVSSYLKGIGLLQVSTGAIEEIDLGSDFTERESRRTAAMEGVPPTGAGLSLVVPPKPIDRVLHIQKR